MAERFTAWLERPWSVGQAILYGTLAVGVLDGLAAIVAVALRGTSPYRLFQGIAVGLLGRASYEGGWSTSVLGLALHFVVALGIVSTFVVASRVLRLLAERPLLVGPLYGVAAFFVMNLVVIPLSAIGTVILRWPAAIGGLLIHALLVGPPAAIAAAKANAGRKRASDDRRQS
jgi:hypothetical protein